MSGMSGFSWPSGSLGASMAVAAAVSTSTSRNPTASASLAPGVSKALGMDSGSGAPPVSFPVVSPSQPTTTSGSGTLPVSLQVSSPPEPTVTSSSGAPPISIPVVSLPTVTQPDTLNTISQPPVETPPAGSGEPRITRNRVTVTVATTPDVSTTPTCTSYNDKVAGMAISIMERPSAASTAKPPAPEATDVVFTLFQHPPGASVSKDSGGDTNGNVITGVVVGGVCLVVLILMLIAACRHRSLKPGKRSSAEKGRAGQGGSPATRAAIEAVHRRRQDRKHGGRAQNFGMTRADMAETFYQGDIMAVAGYARGRVPSLTRGDVELAQLEQARCRDTSFGADNAQAPAPRHHPPLRDIHRCGPRRPGVVIPSDVQRHRDYSPVSPVGVAAGGRADYPGYDDNDISPLSKAPKCRP